MPNGMLPSVRGSQAAAKRAYTNDEGAIVKEGQPVCLSFGAADAAATMSAIELPDAPNLIGFAGIVWDEGDQANDSRIKVVEEGPALALVDTTAGVTKFDPLELVADQDYLTVADGSGYNVAIALEAKSAVAGQSLVNVWVKRLALESFVAPAASG